MLTDSDVGNGSTVRASVGDGVGIGSAVDGSGDTSGSPVDRYRCCLCCQWCQCLSVLPLLLGNTCDYIPRMSSDLSCFGYRHEYKLRKYMHLTISELGIEDG